MVAIANRTLLVTLFEGDRSPMITRLADPSPLAPLYATFLEELRAHGFQGEVSSTGADRTVQATDNSIYEIKPEAVVYPRDRTDLVVIARLAAERRFRPIKLAPRGGGTGTNGQSLTSGIIVDLSQRLNHIIEINPAKRWARVEPGVVKDELNAATAAYGLFFAPETSTSDRATIGGMISTDASGQGSCRYGKTRDHVLEVTSVLLGGTVWQSQPLEESELAAARARTDNIGAIHRLLDEIAREEAATISERFPKLNRSLTGYDLAHIRGADGRFDLNSILCGSEGTLAFIAEAKINLVPIPREMALINLRYDSFDAALRDARSLMALSPASIETIDSLVLGMAREDSTWRTLGRFFPNDDAGPAQGINLIEFTADSSEELDALLGGVIAWLAAGQVGVGRRGWTLARGEAEVSTIWHMRKRAVGLLGNVNDERRPVAFVEDTAVPPERLADFIAEFRTVLDRRGLTYGMFGHVDAGVLHVRPALDLKDPAQEALIRIVTDEVVALVRRYGGLLWGEHGKGIRSEYSPAIFGPLYPCLQRIKAAFDPHDQLNPGKVAAPPGGSLLTIDGVPTRGQADRIISAASRSVFDEALHCNGNGACFTFDRDEAMCPSWKARRERRHSPKGRASLTREWLRLLSQSGVDPVAEAAQIRSEPVWLRLPGRIRNQLARIAGEGDFSHEVKEAMDGCLGCKACTTGCPIKVDVPSFRSKFLELYYGRYLRPPRDYLVGYLEGMLPWLARIAPLYNFAIGSRPGRTIIGWLGLTAVPRLTTIALRRELARRGIRIASPQALEGLTSRQRASSVVIVPDAFTTYFDAELVVDLVDMLLHLGVTPWLAPYRPNGKPLHVNGFLGPFARVAAKNAAMLRELAKSGVALVGVDPSMTLTFRSEYVSALGAEHTPEVLLIQEWLASRQDLLPTMPSTSPFVLLPHCTEHTNALGATQDWRSIFERLGQSLEIASVGCCGMAGTYGHDRFQRPVSEAIYRLSWRRKLSAAKDVGRVLATGYSCRTQAAMMDDIHLPHPLQAILALLRAAKSRSDFVVAGESD